MPEPVRIRTACRQDIACLLGLLEQLFALEADFEFDASRQQRGLELLLDCPEGVIKVAEDQGEVVGMATAQQVISTAEGGPALLVEDVVVGRHRQGRGIGSALLQALAQWGAARGACRMQLLADRNNNGALTFYRQTGWRDTNLICMRGYARRDDNAAHSD